jgi:tetratricopeptide (TPR) repeat protein
MALSEVYRLKGDEENWLSTLEAFLKTEDYGLGHAQIQVEIADHFIGKGDWARARPYADAAAESWAAWALLKAGQCAEVMQDWQAAENWYAGLAQRYPENVWAWYEFCRRTGHGDEQRALQFALPFVRRMEFGTADEQFRAAVVHALAKRSRDAAAVFDSVYRLQPTPTIGLHALLEFDESGDIQSRDRILDAIHQRRTENQAAPQSGVAELAELIYNTKPKGALSAAAPEKLEEIVTTAGEGERAVLMYLLGWYMDRTGQKDDAVAYWKRCLRERFADPCNCTRSLAGAALIDRGVAPPDYLAERSRPLAGDSRDSSETTAKQADH